MSYLGTKPGNQVVTSTQIADGAVTTSKIADGAVVTVDIANNAVTPAKLSTGAPTWDASGNLGLGVTPSAWDGTFKVLDVAGGGAVFGYSSGALGTTSNAYYSSAGWKYKATGAAGQYQNALGAHYWYTAASGTAGNAITFTQAMTLDASGNLGVGTTSPGAKLEIGGTNPTINVGPASSTSGGYITYNTSGNYLSINAVTQGVSYRNIVVANDGGSLLVGTTTAVANTKFTVAAGNGLSALSATNTSGTSLYYAAAFYNNGTSYSYCGGITVSGSATTYATSSDYRLKENITPMTGALAVVQQLKPCTYTWKSDGSNGQGFIAHELQEVVPDAVVGEKDAVNEDGSIKPQGIDTSFLVATLTAAIQEQQAIIEQLQADVEALKNPQIIQGN